MLPETQTCSNPDCPKPQPLSIDQFAIRSDTGKRRGQCRDCVSARRHRHWENNKEAIREGQKSHYWANREIVLARNREYWHATKEDRHKQQRSYVRSEQGRKTRNANKQRRLKEEPDFRLKRRVSDAIRIALKKNGGKKTGSTWKHLPYTPDELVAHIEALFSAPENLINGKAWMTWDNHGKYDPETWNDNDPSTMTWELDHIIPHSTFKYKSLKSKACQECWALSNLRPLNAKQNNADGVSRVRHDKKRKTRT